MSHSVFSLRENKSFRSSRENLTEPHPLELPLKSTTEFRLCLVICRWYIFSSIVPCDVCVSRCIRGYCPNTLLVTTQVEQYALPLTSGCSVVYIMETRLCTKHLL